jgi:quercetin dioxygenase-like cupin family protein
MMSYFKKKQDIKKVNKPWGHELWIASDLNSKNYAMKEIFIRTGFKTSFQFHEYKEECNYIISGTGTLLLSDNKIDINKFINNNYSNDEFKNLINNLKSYKLERGSSFHIQPLYVHSVISIDNLTMIESSSLHLNDVYRILDEHGRGHGRIDSEHKN